VLRIIIRTEDRGAAANVNGATCDTYYTTFDVDLPEVEAYLLEHKSNGYVNRHLMGVQLEPINRVAGKTEYPNC
jgi:hypothetical protein